MLSLVIKEQRNGATLSAGLGKACNPEENIDLVDVKNNFAEVLLRQDSHRLKK